MEALKASLATYFKERINFELAHERRSYPPHVLIDFGKMGLLGFVVSKDLGGLGLTFRDQIDLIKFIATHDISTALAIGLNNYLGAMPFILSGRIDDYAEELREFGRGEAFGAFAITESGAGSNPRVIQASCLASEKGWMLNGEKIWIGNGSWAKHIHFFARENECGGMKCFHLTPPIKGLSTSEEYPTMGVRPLVQNKIVADNVFVPKAAELSASVDGIKLAFSTMQYARFGLAGIAIGAMDGCLSRVCEYARNRDIITGKLIDNGIVFARLNLHSLRRLVLSELVEKVASDLDKKAEIPDSVYTAIKILAPEFLFECIDDCMQFLGGRGYIESSHLPRFFLDARLFRIFEGPTEAMEYHLGSILRKTEDVESIFGDLKLCEEIKGKVVEIKGLCESADVLKARQYYFGYAGRIAALALGYSITKNESAKKLFEWQIDSCFHACKNRAFLLHELMDDLKSPQADVPSVAPNMTYEFDEIISSKGVVSGETKARPLVENISSISNKYDKKESVVGSNPISSSESMLSASTASFPLDQELSSILCKAHGKNLEIDPMDRLSEYGIDSITALEFIGLVEETYKVILPEALVWQNPTLRQISEYVQNNARKLP